jgi:hypothetical protein
VKITLSARRCRKCREEFIGAAPLCTKCQKGDTTLELPLEEADK